MSLLISIQPCAYPPPEYEVFLCHRYMTCQSCHGHKFRYTGWGDPEPCDQCASRGLVEVCSYCEGRKLTDPATVWRWLRLFRKAVVCRFCNGQGGFWVHDKTLIELLPPQYARHLTYVPPRQTESRQFDF